MFLFHHQRADLHFSWDGWMQIRVRPEQFTLAYAFPDRFDIREPDLRDPARHPHPRYPEDGSVHLVPETQEAFEALCDTWWRGGELCVGLRDYAADPWQIRSWGITQGVFRYRYTGGSHIEASPGEGEVWRPLIELAADDRTPSTLSTRWLAGRVDGWEIAWLAAHGILDQGHGIDDALVHWTIATLPAPSPRGSIKGQFGSWLSEQAANEFAGDVWTQRRDLGEYTRHVTPARPWSTTREDSEGTRWNFWWCGHPYAYVYSPDRRLTHEESLFAVRPEQEAPGDVIEWLERRADA